MHKAQTATLLLACISIFAVNFPHVIPHYYKRAFTPVGPDTVSVSLARSDPSALTVPLETGQRIEVFVRANYRVDAIDRTPRLTLALLLGFAILYVIITRITTKSPAAIHPK